MPASPDTTRATQANQRSTSWISAASRRRRRRRTLNGLNEQRGDIRIFERVLQRLEVVVRNDFIALAAQKHKTKQRESDKQDCQQQLRNAGPERITARTRSATLPACKDHSRCEHRDQSTLRSLYNAGRNSIRATDSERL